jgi:hypothetical protein
MLALKTSRRNKMEIRNERVILDVVPGAVAMVLAGLVTFIFIVAPFAAISVGATI